MPPPAPGSADAVRVALPPEAAVAPPPASTPSALHAVVLQLSLDGAEGSRGAAFSDPLVLPVLPSATVGELRARAARLWGASPAEAAEWPAALVPVSGQPQPLADADRVVDRLPADSLQGLYGHVSRACVGFARENKNVRRTNAHINRALAASGGSSGGGWNGGYGAEKQLKIKA